MRCLERLTTLRLVLSSRFGASTEVLEPLLDSLSRQPLPAELLPALLSAGSVTEAEQVLRLNLPKDLLP